MKRKEKKNFQNTQRIIPKCMREWVANTNTQTYTLAQLAIDKNKVGNACCAFANKKEKDEEERNLLCLNETIRFFLHAEYIRFEAKN